MDKQKHAKINTPVIFISALIFLLAAGSLFWIVWQTASLGHNADGICVADIYQDGELLMTLPLSASPSGDGELFAADGLSRINNLPASAGNPVEEETPLVFVIEGENGAYNEITIKEGKIGVTAASCPDHLCMRQGFIHTSLLPITCLPNKLVIQVRNTDWEPPVPEENASEASHEADAVTY